jgi:hypothetical protein
MNFLTGLLEVIETLQELKRMHQLNMELLEQLSIACDYLLKSAVAVPNANLFASLLNKAMALLNEIQSGEPKVLQYTKVADEKKQQLGTDDKETGPLSLRNKYILCAFSIGKTLVRSGEILFEGYQKVA